MISSLAKSWTKLAEDSLTAAAMSSLVKLKKVEKLIVIKIGFTQKKCIQLTDSMQKTKTQSVNPVPKCEEKSRKAGSTLNLQLC